MRNGISSACPRSCGVKRTLTGLIAGACGDWNQAFISGNTGLPSSCHTSTSHGPARMAIDSAAPPTYLQDKASGKAATTKIAFEYLSAAAAPNSAPAKAALGFSFSSSSRPASRSGASSGSRNEVPTVGQNTARSEERRVGKDGGLRGE